MITLDTKEIDADYGGGMPMMTATNYSINFTYSYGDEEKFFNISVSHYSVVYCVCTDMYHVEGNFGGDKL